MKDPVKRIERPGKSPRSPCSSSYGCCLNLQLPGPKKFNLKNQYNEKERYILKGPLTFFIMSQC